MFHYFYQSNFFLFLIHLEPRNHKNSRTGPQDLLVTHCDCEVHNQKTYKYAINYVAQCESEPQDNKSTIVIAALNSKSRATTLTGYTCTIKISEKKVHCSQVSKGNKTRLDHESFSQSKHRKITISWPRTL